LDNLACDLDYAYLCHLREWDVDPWPLRDAYIAVVLGEQDGPDFLAQHGLGHLDEETAQQVLGLLEAQFYRQRMYASCTFFFEDLDRHEPHYAIANAIRALALTRGATGEDLSHSFRRDLHVALSGRTGRTGEQIFDALLERADR
jgi:hypothetical protein